GLGPGGEQGGDLRVAGAVTVPHARHRAVIQGGEHASPRDYPENMGEHGLQSGIIGTVMTVPINSEVDPGAAAAISPEALAALLGRWPTSDGALYRLLAARIGRPADTRELPPGVRAPARRAPTG